MQGGYTVHRSTCMLNSSENWVNETQSLRLLILSHEIFALLTTKSALSKNMNDAFFFINCIVVYFVGDRL